jgi:hypothetical protein
MIGQTEIRGLAEETGFPRVSLYLPTHKAGPDLRQGPIRLKTMLRDAAGALEKRGLTARDIDALFADVRSHTESETDPFWQHQEQGLAIYISPERTRYVQAPLHFEPKTHVGRRFLVKPLLPILMRDGTFYVLAASQDGATLFTASRFGMSAVSDERLAVSAAEFVGRTQFTNAVGWHAASRGGGNAQFHGLGESPQDGMQEQVERYAVAVAKAVDEILSGLDVPLVIAADDRMLGMLRKSLHYKCVVEEGLRTHPGAVGADELRQRAYDLVRERLEEERSAAMERFEARRRGAGSGATARIEEVVPAAAEGRVDSLIVAVEASAEGVFDREQNRAVVSPARGEQTMDLVDYAILQTLAHGGAVYSRPVHRADDFPPVGAVYRY